ncbi:hypothetical protein BU16DRAFT_545331 [Lophium mytilinum]|uniref:Uncharacterized protein n=1 Tax=Lophium mytilinum TaxID=390894 RepID=A0A6A6QAN6_9PEZI|nr:hypothetical protein BU16DRAFT_545331 [Lophium mytilinum]
MLANVPGAVGVAAQDEEATMDFALRWHANLRQLRKPCLTNQEMVEIPPLPGELENDILRWCPEMMDKIKEEYRSVEEAYGSQKQAMGNEAVDVLQESPGKVDLSSDSTRTRESKPETSKLETSQIKAETSNPTQSIRILAESSKYGATCWTDCGLCYLIFVRAKICPKGDKCDHADELTPWDCVSDWFDPENYKLYAANLAIVNTARAVQAARNRAPRGARGGRLSRADEQAYIARAHGRGNFHGDLNIGRFQPPQQSWDLMASSKAAENPSRQDSSGASFEINKTQHTLGESNTMKRALGTELTVEDRNERSSRRRRPFRG